MKLPPNLRFAAITCDQNESKRGGPGRGQGRKRLAKGENTVRVNLSMTQGQRDKLLRLGGSEWLRVKIEEAQEPGV